jgi:DNA-binding NarL/FixJ family response regulator
VWAAEFQAAGSRARAADTLSSALRIADSLDAQSVMRDAAALARRANLTVSAEPVRRRADAKVHLTDREMQVLARVVRGETNRRIARALFISERTASVHVSNIIRKLGCKNRGEAAAIAHRLKLVPTMEET